MRVIAIRQGFLGQFREEGDVFEIEQAQFSKTWMASADEVEAQVSAETEVEATEPHAKPRRGRKSSDEVI